MPKRKPPKKGAKKPPKRKPRKGGRKPPKGPPKPPAPEPRKKLGRRCEINPEVVECLIRAVGNGTPKVKAVKLARVCYQTFMNWCERGKAAWELAGEDGDKVPAEDVLFVELFVGIEEATAVLVDEELTNIRRAGKKHWQASSWLLTRVAGRWFADNRHEIAELKKMLGGLMGELAALKNATPPPKPEDERAAVPEMPTPVPAPPVPEPVPIIPTPAAAEPSKIPTGPIAVYPLAGVGEKKGATDGRDGLPAVPEAGGEPGRGSE